MSQGALDGKPRVRDYMTRDVSTVAPDDTVGEVVERITNSDEPHSGYPVTSGRRVEGFITPATCWWPATTTRCSP